MFERKRDITKELKALVEATVDLPRGSLITHEEIENHTGIGKDHKSRGTLINKWKQGIRLKRGVLVVASVPAGVGYRFLGVDEQLTVQPLKYKKQAIKRINKAGECLGAISDEELDDDGKRTRVFLLGQLAELKEKDKTQRAETNSFLSAPKTLPKINGK